MADRLLAAVVVVAFLAFAFLIQEFVWPWWLAEFSR